MLKEIAGKYFKNFRYYFKIVLENSIIMKEHPYYYIRNFLNIIKSFSSTLLVKFPNLNIHKIVRKINGVNFIFDFNFHPTFRGMYLGLNSILIVRTMLEYIKRNSIFIDIGANLGYLSAVGAGLVGKKGQVHSFEPVPLYFNQLLQLAKINKDYKIVTNNFALGEVPGISEMSINNQEILGWNTMVPGWIDSQTLQEKITVEVRRLDEYIFNNKLDNISFMKIDVEGFELPVLRGLTKFFDEKLENLPPLVVEINPQIYPLLGLKLKELGTLMEKYQYKAYSTDEKYTIDLKKIDHLRSLTDVLFLQER